jgi:thioredoxin 2
MIRPCPRCGAKNRVPAARLADTGRCGKCKEALAPLAEPVDVADAATFDDIVRGATVPVVVDFWADWCGPCKMVAPQVKRAAAELSSRAVVLKVDTERVPELAARYQVRSIPNFVVFKNGAPVAQRAGALDARALTAWVTGA